MATYVYAVVRAGHALPTGAAGVGGSGRLRILRAEDDTASVAAVVGDAPEDLRARRRDLAAHHEVLTELAEHGPVLPLQFGTVVRSDGDVAHHLAEHAAGYREALTRIAGKTELNVKAELDLDAVLGDIVATEPDILALRERTRTGGSYEDQLQLGEKVAAATARYAAAIEERVVEVLAPYAVAYRPGPSLEGHAANISFLVQETGVAAFAAAVDGLRGDIGPGVELRCTGPLPTYSFASPEVAV
ncbi:GvpL/GvpF family gas vesicle protein [Streptodolium elevatio]|uniref:GvpL/GvpF family gas vesicle protein n=1 Tax=Streptodolium elevatio TaxID=3157996 RepID=A0ABV3DWP2_9ACTN